MDEKRSAAVAAQLERLAREIDRLGGPRFLAEKARKIYETLSRLSPNERAVLIAFHSSQARMRLVSMPTTRRAVRPALFP